MMVLFESTLADTDKSNRTNDSGQNCNLLTNLHIVHIV